MSQIKYENDDSAALIFEKRADKREREREERM
jgi:hypothetical protein